MPDKSCGVHEILLRLSDGSEVSQASSSSASHSGSDPDSHDSEAASSSNSEEMNEIDSSRRLQDLSEDDFESDAEPEVDISEQYRYGVALMPSNVNVL